MSVRHAASTWATLGLIAACLALAGPAAAQPRLDPSTQLREDIDATRDDAVLEFKVVFTMQQDSQAYLKVSPRTGNPVFGNGTAGGEGWWTEVVLEGPDGVLYEGTTAGDPPTDFGDLESNVTYTLWLRAHAPAGALDQTGNLTLDYILAEHVDSTSAGSGGTLDESVGLHAVVRIQGEPSASVDGFRMPMWAWAAIAVGALALAAAVGVALKRRSPGNGPGSQG